MARPAPAGGVRGVQVLVRVNAAEAAQLDQQRGALTRAEYLRWKALGTRRST